MKNFQDRPIGDLQRLADAKLGKGYHERIAMLALLDNPRMGMTELGKAIPLSRAAVTTLTDRLEDAKVITRIIPPRGEDRRRIYLELTRSGRTKIAMALDETANLKP